MDLSPIPSSAHEISHAGSSFSGVSRNSMPEWRKELSERVRRSAAKRAHSAREASEAERKRAEVAINPPNSSYYHPPNAGHESAWSLPL